MTAVCTCLPVRPEGIWPCSSATLPWHAGIDGEDPSLMDEPYDVIAHTDGGCRGNPGPGGWAFVLVNPANGKALERCGGVPDTTNNRMEMQAAVEALKAISRPGLRVLLHSDSQYLVKAMSEWIAGWKARGWKRKEGALKNVDLLQELDRLAQVQRVTWRWVRGHNGDRGNERVDALANQAMDRLQAGADPAWEQRTTW